MVPWISLRQLDPAGHLEVVAWVALAPLLLALERARSARGAFTLGLVAGLAYFFAAIHWVSHAMTAFGGLPFAVAFLGLTLLVGFMAFHWGLAAAATWALRTRLGWPLALAAPPAFTAGELLRNYLFTGFPWGNLGYTQARTLPVAQLAALTGVYGIAFLVVLVNAALADALSARLAGRPLPRRPLAAAAAALLLTTAGGAFRLAALRRELAAAP